MAKANTQAQATKAQATKAPAKRLTVADLAAQMTALTEAVTALTALVTAQAQTVQAPAKEAPAPAKQEKAPKGKKGAKAKADAKAKLPKPSFEEWSEYKKSHWFVVANDPECPTKHDKNSKLYRLFLKARKEGKA